jgi:hypothetical protein
MEMFADPRNRFGSRRHVYFLDRSLTSGGRNLSG